MKWRSTPCGVLLVGLAACGAQGPQRGHMRPIALPAVAMRHPEPAPAIPPRRSNGEMAQDYLDLVFQLESGRAVAAFSRFEGPVRVSMTGAVPPTAPSDLAALLARLRSEAGIDIAAVPSGGNFTIEFLPRRTMQALVPDAACFVVPNVRSWTEYRHARRSGVTDWAALTRRDRATVFVPSDTAPQEVRDCLNEEIAQGLGPLNDLYRLPDSVFNDDNFHGVLTGFDMLMLRVHMAPEFRNGMSRGAVAAALPGVLARINPVGGGFGGGDESATPPAYVHAIERALRPGAAGSRQGAAAEAVAIADSMGWMDGRAGFAHFTLGRLLLATAPDRAVASLALARQIYAGRGMAIQAAHVDLYLAGLALKSAQPDAVDRIADAAIPAARAEANAALWSQLLMMKAEAATLRGDAAAGARLRLDSAALAGYGFGSQAGVRLADIAALTPQPGPNDGE